jgi:hypothetical protein
VRVHPQSVFLDEKHSGDFFTHDCSSLLDAPSRKSNLHGVIGSALLGED